MALSSESNTKLTIGDEKHLIKPEDEEEEEDDLLSGMEMICSIVFPMALQSAVDLGIFDIIAKAGEGAKLSANEIAVQLGTSNPEAPTMLNRLLRLLASHSLLRCTIPEDTQKLGLPQILYSLTSRSKSFVTDTDGMSWGPVLALAVDKVFYPSWAELKGAILEGGKPFNRVYGMHAFEYQSVDPRFNEVFNKAMISNTTITMKRILEVYKGFKDINRLVDVGGSLGVNLKLITSKYPHIQGINFDLPHVIEHAYVYAGVENVGGDMFESVPTGDAIFMKWILRDWSDEHCVKLLKNCYKAIPADGKAIVVDQILPDVPDTTTTVKTAYESDVFMMTHYPGGKQRTKQEFLELATESGFGGIRFVCCVSGYWVMEFYK